MPKIPSFQENQRIQQGSPVQAESVEAAGRDGSLISQFGSSVANLGKAFAIRDKAEKDLFGRMVKAQGMVAAQRAFVQARQSPDLAEGGGNLQDEFDKAYAKNVGGLVSSFSDKHREFGGLILGEVAASRKESLLVTELGMGEAKINLDVERSEATMISGIHADPENADQYIKNHLDFIEGNPLWNSAIKAKVMDASLEVISKAKISGYLNKNDFKSAYKTLEEDTFLGQKEKDEEFARIEGTQNARFNQTQKVMRAEEVRRNKELTERQSANYAKLMVGLATVTTPEGYEALLEKSTRQLQTQEISSVQWKAAQSPDARVTPAEDEESLSRYVIRLYDSKQNLDTMVHDLTADKAAGRIKGSTYASIMGMIKTERATRTSMDPMVRVQLGYATKALTDIIGSGARRDVFNNIRLNTAQIATLKNGKNRLARAARNGEKAIDREFISIMTDIPTGDSAILGVPSGVDAKEVRSKFSVEKGLETRGTRLQKLLKSGVPESDEQVRKLVKEIQGLEKHKNLFDEKEAAKEAGRATSEDRGDGTSRRRRNR